MEDKELEQRLKEIDVHMRRYANKLAKNQDDADDLYQDAYVKIWTNRDKYKEDKSFKSWCYTVMYNLFITSIQNKKKLNTTTVSDLASLKESFISDKTSEDSQIHYSSTYGHINASYNDAESSITVDDIFDTIDDVLDGVHKTIVMSRISGESLKEVSEKTGLSVSNCKVKCFYALKKVRESLEERFDLTDEYKTKLSLLDINRVYHTKQASADTTYRRRFKEGNYD